MADPRHAARTLPKVLALQAAQRGDQPFLLLPRAQSNGISQNQAADGALKYHTVTFSQFQQMTFQARAQLVQVTTPLGGTCRIRKGDRMAILASNSPEYIVATFAAWLQGAMTVNLSTRVGDEALQHLVSQSAPSVLLVSQECESAAKRVLKTLDVPDRPLLLRLNMGVLAGAVASGSSVLPPMFTIVVDGEMNGHPTQSNGAKESHVATVEVDDRDYSEAFAPAVIMHTGGTTGLPKQVVRNHDSLIELIRMMHDLDPPYAPPGTLPTQLGWMPLFHAIGFIIEVGLPIYSGSPYYSAKFAAAPSPEGLLQAIVDSGSQLMFVVPIIAEQWCHMIRREEEQHGESKTLTTLLTLHALIYAGAPLAEWAGSFLVSKGVRLTTAFGSTEIGAVALAGPRWADHIRFVESRVPGHVILGGMATLPGMAQGYLQSVDRETGKMKIRPLAPSPDEPYQTGDLFTVYPHSSDGLTWIKSVIRADNLLVHTTGEKTNPTAFEGAVQELPFVKDVIAVGSGYPRPGLVVKPDWAAVEQLTPVGQGKEEWVRGQVWALIQAINKKMPSSSWVARGAICVLSPQDSEEVTFPRTVKGEIARGPANELLKSHVAAMFAGLEAPPQKSVLPVANGVHTKVKVVAYDRVLDTVRRRAAQVLGLDARELDAQPGGEPPRLLDLGLSSLTATELAQAIAEYVGVPFPATMLYEDVPDVVALAEWATAALQTEAEHAPRSNGAVPSTNSNHSPNGIAPEGKGTFLFLTGATGFIGSHVLKDLLSRPADEVATVVCLVRGPSVAACQARLHQALLRAGKDLKSRTGARVVVVPGDLQKPLLGMTPDDWRLWGERVHTVIHCGAAVHLTAEYEKLAEANEKSVQEIIRFALQGVGPPKPVHFASSVSVSFLLGATQKNGEVRIMPEAVDFVEERGATRMGYALTKRKAELALKAAAQGTSVPVFIYRIGLALGSTENDGLGAADNMFTWLIRAAKTFKKLPRLGPSAWMGIPVDYLATTWATLCLRNTRVVPDELPVYHLIPFTPQSWDDIYEAMRSNGLPFETLGSVAEWAADVRTAAETDRKLTQFLPLIPLLEGLAARPFPSFATERTRRALKMAGVNTPTLLSANELRLLVQAVG
ncbi:hypothetical protein KFL_006760020 [Klebsormidium nitens]|uniref:Carrier domain-containing protein n=1 Tax=Klebsormidium nitens TaxID=105231 RepID=A0A1Y1IJ27_KLENI|nr:hypothetical protein KFL_006760020 [Klebsormidium nitens]|eukprot:GAQ90703.1 hypothetical protein KFL_006760020 [Klebsormidium nitens]